MDLPKGRIAIFSGEGETGSWKEYTGARTEQALKTRLTKERCHGQRWAYAYIETDRINKYTGEAGYQEIHWEKNQNGEDVLMCGEMRTPNMAELNVSQAAAALGRKGGQVKSEAKAKAVRENGKKGGRPKGSKPALVHVVLYDSPDQKTGTGVTPENPVTHQKASWIIRKSKYGGYTFRCTDQIDGTQCECH